VRNNFSGINKYVSLGKTNGFLREQTRDKLVIVFVYTSTGTSGLSISSRAIQFHGEGISGSLIPKKLQLLVKKPPLLVRGGFFLHMLNLKMSST